MGVLESIVLAGLPYVPRPVMRRLAAPYVAGETLDDALARLGELQSLGHPGILDVLGEDVDGDEQADRVLADYRTAAERVAQAGLDAYVSVKPTHFGLRMSEEKTLGRYSELAGHCASLGLFLRVEMEDASTTDGTLRVFEALRKEHENVGVVLQSRLFRTPDDIAALAPGPLDVRLVKGIYLEPPEIAHTEPDPIREAFLDCSKQLLDRGARIGFATHDEGLAERLLEQVRAAGAGPDRYEFQVLLGVQRRLWDLWREAGHTVRVYVPFGPDWLPYSLRRLTRNPEILRHLIRATLRLG